MMTPQKITVVAGSMTTILLLSVMILPDISEQNLLFFQSEKSKIMDARQGYPDQFFQYHHDIRANEHGVVEYPVGYRTTEFQKALAKAKNTGSTIGWVERGPGNVGGRTRPVLVDLDDPLNTWWVGSVSGGLWKTTSRGNRWSPQTEHFAIMATTSLAMAESDPNVIYMGTGEGYGNIDGVDGNGIFKSTDRGSTWIHLQSTAAHQDFRHVNRLAVDPSDPDVVIAATGRGIFRSADGGNTWTEVYTGPGRVQDLRAQPGNFNRLIAGINGQGIFYSDDAGLSWSQASAVFRAGVARVEVTFSPSHPNIAYAAVEGSSSELLRSDDGGQSWAATFQDSANPTNWLASQGWYDNAIAVHPFKPDTVFVGGVELWRIRMGDDVRTFSGPSTMDRGGTENWMALTDFGASHFGGTVVYLDPEAVGVTEADYSSIEIRFGQGTQKAHRFIVAEDAGTFGNGGSGVRYNQYQYAGYVNVPLQVWDTDNNRQLMFSFRDQADDGAFNLIPAFTSQDPGTRNQQSREYMFIHHYDYDDANPQASIAAHGGLVNGLLYFMWPTLENTATWDPANLPAQTISIGFSSVVARERFVDISGTPNIPHVDHHNILPLPIDAESDRFWILNANDGGVALSTNGGRSFVEKDRAFAGYNTSQFYGVSKKPGESVYLGGTQDNGTWRSFENPDNRRLWSYVIGGDGLETLWHAKDPDKAMGTIQFTWILRSVDGGISFQAIFDGDSRGGGLFLSPLATSDMAPDEVYTLTQTGVWRTANFGEHWDQTRMTSNWGAWSGCTVRVSKADPNIVWTGCGLESSAGGRRLHVSRNRGRKFDITAAASVVRPPNALLTGLATHPTESETAYALFSPFGRAKVLETKDLGASWTDLSHVNASGVSTNGFPDVAVYDLIVMPHAPNVMWVGTDIGLFQTKSYGKEWNYAHNGLPAVSVWRMKIRDDEVIVATHGRGIWTVPIGEIDVAIEEDASGELPSEVVLAQNYPNPFNASTNISFDVPHEANIRVTVFDALGRRIETLTNQIYAPGSHDLTWDASAYASGTYFYRLEANNTLIQTQKMVLLK